MTTPRQQRIVIVGAGFGGIAQAIELQRHGYRDITILEAAPHIGGTWLHNSYPGSACDVPSHLYSFSYAQRRDWSRLCSPQEEILEYLTGVAREYRVDRFVVADTRVTACRWDDATRHWTVETDGGTDYDADVLVVATGQLHQPAWPRLENREAFHGHSFHSAEWDHDYDLRGKRVAVIGTGASAVQFVPEIAKQTAHLVVFQRTGNYLLPRQNRPYPKAVKTFIGRAPVVQNFLRRFWFYYCELLTMMIRHPETLGRLGRLRSTLFMRRQLRDPDLRRRVWPDYTFGCKRILFSSAFLPALGRPDVDLVTAPLTGLTETGVVAADGTHHEVDCIIYGTGFKTNDFMFPMEITGTGGRSLRDAWAQGAHAHLGMTVPGFPSLFVLYGPNTNTSGGSIIVYLEAQAAYVRQALEHLDAVGATALDVRTDVEQATDAAVQENFAGTAWTRCDSWYRDDEGRIVANWPGYMNQYVDRTRTFDAAEYELV